MDTVNFNIENFKIKHKFFTTVCQVNQKTLTQIGLSHEELVILLRLGDLNINFINCSLIQIKTTLTKKCKNVLGNYMYIIYMYKIFTIIIYNYILLGSLLLIIQISIVIVTENNNYQREKLTEYINEIACYSDTELTSSVLYTVLQYKWLRYNSIYINSIDFKFSGGKFHTRDEHRDHHHLFLKNISHHHRLLFHHKFQIHQIVVLCDLNFLLFHSHNPLNLSCFYPLHFLPLHSHCNYLYPYCSDHYHFQLDGKVSSASSILVFSFDTIAERDFLLLLLLLFDFVSSNLMLVVEEFAGFKPILSSVVSES
ncbi:hypothetical protein KUTeg_002156 [Tegillarca granosa]|uniref:Uncharacterized protein n=1 Tax=Tegillarca granosa TaxID=220873 RepID=A0ABQ9FTH7_TEGGR|nr:hypothetical protein KUTeg_002156 [Tegillarca granosa]